MKKLFMLLVLLTTANFTEARIHALERNKSMVVVCIQEYVFVRDEQKGQGGGLVQFMVWDSKEKVMKPLRCSDYKY
tara:strand:- start:240 stop:467 length:228 start_codon:yes stop_codon:yes gene_type:complete